MSTVTITLTDVSDDDGEVNIVLESDPPLPGRNSGREYTLAQDMALKMLGAVATPADITGVEAA